MNSRYWTNYGIATGSLLGVLASLLGDVPWSTMFGNIVVFVLYGAASGWLGCRLYGMMSSERSLHRIEEHDQVL